MNKKQMVMANDKQIQALSQRLGYLETQLKEECKTRIQMSKDIYTEIRTNTELNLPVPGMQTLSVPGDPDGRRYVKVVELMLAVMRHLGLKLEYEPHRYTLKEKQKVKPGKF